MSFLETVGTLSTDNIIALIGILVTAAITIIVARMFHVKHLDYEFSIQRLLTRHLDLLKIEYDGVVVTEPRLLTIKVVNSGRQVIRSDDFEENLQFQFGKDVRLVAAEPVATYPSEVNVELLSGPESISISPLLLNPTDQFKIQVLVDGKPSVNLKGGRVAGVQKIRRITQSSKEWPLMLFGCGILTILFSLTFLVSKKNVEYPSWKYIFGITLILGFAVAIYSGFNLHNLNRIRKL